MNDQLAHPDRQKLPGHETLGLAVVTLNEGQTIQRCLESVPFADQIVVVDSGSTDNTVSLARQLKADVVYRKWTGYSEQKQFAIDLLKTDWILALDGDEWLTAQCQSEIQSLLKNPNQTNAYFLPRYHLFLGKVLRHGRGVDQPLRLFRRGTGKYTTREIHEEIKVEGTVNTLKYGMVHASSPSISKRTRKMFRDLKAEMRYLPPQRPGLRKLFLDPARYFFSYTLKRGGWRDGLPGLIWTAFFSLQIFIQQVLFFAVLTRGIHEDPARR